MTRKVGEIKIIKTISVVDENIAPDLIIDVEIYQTNKAVIKYSIAGIIKDSYECHMNELKNLIIPLLKEINIRVNKDEVIKRAIENLNENLK